jgi:uncharacterized protein
MHHRTLHDVIGPERTELVLRDGVVLVSDIYRPAGDDLHPVLLMRQPYGRAIASTVVLAHPSWYASHGYIVVVQDVRGCGDSGGDFEAFVNEVEDGAQTLDWAAALPGGNGRIGLYGFSYQAMTQYLAIAGKGSQRPDAIAPAMGSWMPREDWAYEGSVFRLGLNVGWAAQMAKLKASHAGDMATHAAIDAMPEDALLTYLRQRPGLSHLSKWIGNEEAYWDSVSPGHLLKDDPLNIPVLHTGGWADFLFGGTWTADRAFREKSPDTSHLVVGPWAHAPWNRMSGATDMGAAAEFSVDRAQIEFFDFYLKDRGEKPASIRLFDMGRREWRTFAAHPATTAEAFHLSSSGLAAATMSDGKLQLEPSAGALDTFVSDPFRPTPLIGGHLGSPAGFADRRATDNRADIATYTTAPFSSDETYAGEISAEIAIRSPDGIFDICLTLSLVAPDGAANVLATAHARIDSNKPAKIPMRAVCATVAAGYALRLSVQGAAAPAFETHPEGDAIASSLPRKPRTISIHHGGATSSRLIMPKVIHDAG